MPIGALVIPYYNWGQLPEAAIITSKLFLSEVSPFSKLPREAVERLTSMAREARYTKGETIFSEGDEGHSVWVLVKGHLDIYKYTSAGKPRVIETIMPKDLFGTLCRLGSENRAYPCTAVAADDSVALQIPDTIFMQYFQKYPELVSGVCTLCSQRLSQMQDQSCMTQEPVDRRIARVLLDLGKKHGTTIPCTKREIAEMAGTTVETTIRTMSQFQKKKWISSARGQVTLQDTRELEMLAR